MKKLFDINSPIMQFLGKVGNLMCLNMLFLIFCIPVVTIGAAVTSMHKVTQAMVIGEDPFIVRTFLRGFRENFKTATPVWLVILAFGAIIAFNYLVTISYLAAGTALICQRLLLFVSVVILAISSYLFPLIARYENSITGYLLNASVLAIGKLPRTVLLVLLNGLPLAMIYVTIGAFSKSLILWVLIGFALISFLSSTILLPVFREFENKEDEASK